MRFTHRTKKVMALIVAPFSFLLLGYGLIYALASPTIRPLYSIYSLITSEYGPSFDDTRNNLYNQDHTNKKDTIDLRDVVIPSVGEQYGEIHIGGFGMKVKLFYGDDEDILLYGAGQFQGSFMPGFNHTTLIAGHTIPYFKILGDIKKGDDVLINTHYGEFQYKVTDIKVGKFNDSSMYDLAQDKKEQLILYTCYPLDGIGFKQDRLFVYADKVGGTHINGV